MQVAATKAQLGYSGFSRRDATCSWRCDGDEEDDDDEDNEDEDKDEEDEEEKMRR